MLCVSVGVCLSAWCLCRWAGAQNEGVRQAWSQPQMPPCSLPLSGSMRIWGDKHFMSFFFFLLEWQNLVTCNLGTVAEKPLQINRVNVLLHFLFYISILKMRLNWYTGGGLVLFLYVLFVIVDAAVYCHFWICANCNVVFKDRVKEAKHPLIINLYYIVVHN